MEFRNYSAERQERMKRGALAAIISLSIILIAALVGLGVMGFFLYANNEEKTEYRNDLENIYQKSYYDLVSEVTTMENDLYKFKVSASPVMQIKLLENIAKSAANSETNLSSLKLDNDTGVTAKFFNQVGDYAKALSNKLSSGKTLSEEEIANMNSFAELAKNVGIQLASLQTQIVDNGFSFMNGSNLDSSPLTEIVSELENNTIEYPSLIYDGPFSDGLVEKEAKGLSGDIISKEMGAEIIARMFNFLNVENISFQSVSTNHFNQLRYAAKINGLDYIVSLSEQGGQLVDMSSFKEIDNPKFTAEECAELGKQFLEKLGYKDMEGVWVSNSNSTVFVNYTVKLNDTIIYPDMIKLKIASDTGDVIGFEALTYVFNHTERTIEKPAITAEQAKTKLNKNLEVKSSRLALIPLDGGREELSYEFQVTFEENTYYIYVSAVSGNEINILRVIDGDDGALLM